MPYYFRDLTPSGTNWTRTQSGWRSGEYSNDESGSTRPTFILTEQVKYRDTNNDAQELQKLPMLHNIQGIANERRTFVSLSDAVLKLEIDTIAVQVSGFRFCAEVFRQLLKDKFGKLSGTFKTYMFKTIEKMHTEALSTELHVPVIKSLLQTSLQSLNGPNQGIGSKVLWKKNQESVNQMISKTNKFQFTQPDEDSPLLLLDLPKECLQKILLHMSDHKDILRFGSTCSYLHELTKDPFLWREMCLTQFTEKQLPLYVFCVELNEVDWLKIYKTCLKKVKVLRCVYGNQLVLCNNCRAVFWKMQGHSCINPQDTLSYTLMTPSDFINLFCL